jgi:hypothetical protein
MKMRKNLLLVAHCDVRQHAKTAGMRISVTYFAAQFC